jgi:ABC-type multidrug transport system ATPase subunit
MPPLYSLRKLTRSFGEREVLHIDALDIESGVIYALLGANGAGKSTLMRVLAFLDKPTSGEIFFRGDKLTPGQEAVFRQGVVWVPQFPVMFTGSLLYNVAYPMALKRVSAAERNRNAMEYLELVNLAHLASAPAHLLSGGESQRASIARAMAAGAEVILFDEPTANIDERSQGEFITLVRNLWQNRGLSLLVTTHNANLAATLCHKQIFLVEGHLVRQHVLPGGGVAWPAKLSHPDDRTDGRILAAVQPEALAYASSGEGEALLQGIVEIAAGIVLYVEASPGRVIEILLADESSRNIARALSLGSRIGLRVEKEEPLA